MLRVITGTAKGTLLKVPNVAGVRPATDLVRGAIFSILENLTDDWSRVLDLFSGSGSLGIEALSRGAGWVDFVDRERRCCDIIKQNLVKTRLAEKAHVYCSNVAKIFAFMDEPYAIILIDPPYKDKTIGELLSQIAASKLIEEHTIVVITHSSRFLLEQDYGVLQLVKERRHGDSTISVYRRES
jgi:16S rRNA (guanine966-N2)-methyltransferase